MQARDRTLLYASAFLRALATGMVGVLLGIYLAKLSLTPGEAGWSSPPGCGAPPRPRCS